MKLVISFLLLSFISNIYSQDTKSDGDWSQQLVALKNTPEAEYMIRIGDIDNLSYGWPADFNPFSGRSTYSHDWPFNINPDDAVGTDRVMIPSSYVKDPSRGGGCSSDGYSGGDHNTFKAVPLQMPLESLKNAEIKSAACADLAAVSMAACSAPGRPKRIFSVIERENRKMSCSMIEILRRKASRFQSRTSTPSINICPAFTS